MKTKVSELTGPALDYAAIIANGQCAEYWLEMYLSEGRRVFCARHSTEWVYGGPIIERESIGVRPNGAEWVALHINPHVKPYKGLTPLIAALRCFVASKLGDEVEIPEELA